MTIYVFRVVTEKKSWFFVHSFSDDYALLITHYIHTVKRTMFSLLMTLLVTRNIHAGVLGACIIYFFVVVIFFVICNLVKKEKQQINNKSIQKKKE